MAALLDGARAAEHAADAASESASSARVNASTVVAGLWLAVLVGVAMEA